MVRGYEVLVRDPRLSWFQKLKCEETKYGQIRECKFEKIFILKLSAFIPEATTMKYSVELLPKIERPLGSHNIIVALLYRQLMQRLNV